MERRNIVYVTSKWHLTGTPFTYESDPDQRLYDAQIKILDYLNSQKIAPVIFKLNNTENFNMSPHKFQNVKYEKKMKFVDVLKKAKIVILDGAATTLIESCSTSLPIFVLGGRTLYYDDYLINVKKRVVWCDTVSELVQKVDLYLTQQHYEADLEDMTFINNYNISFPRDILAENVTSILLNSIENQEC